MKKPSVLLISGWAHGAEAMHPLAEAMAESHRVTSLSLADLGAPGINVRGRRGSGIQGKGEDRGGQERLTRRYGDTETQGQKGRHGDTETRRRGDNTLSPSPLLPLADIPFSAISPYARAIAFHLDRSAEPACIVGWSTGGVAAIEAAANYPEKVCGLVLLSATARFCADTGYSAGVDPAVLRSMIRGLTSCPETVIADFLVQALYPARISSTELARRTANALKQGTNSLIDGLEYLARVDLRDALPTITTPCLIIHGRQDRIVPRQAAQFLVSKLPVSDVELVPSAGHSLIEQRGKDLIYRILQFQELLR